MKIPGPFEPGASHLDAFPFQFFKDYRDALNNKGIIFNDSSSALALQKPCFGSYHMPMVELTKPAERIAPSKSPPK